MHRMERKMTHWAAMPKAACTSAEIRPAVHTGVNDMMKTQYIMSVWGQARRQMARGEVERSGAGMARLAEAGWGLLGLGGKVRTGRLAVRKAC